MQAWKTYVKIECDNGDDDDVRFEILYNEDKKESMQISENLLISTKFQ